MNLKIMDKYIIKEMFGPFIFGLAIFTILFFSGSQLFIVAQMATDERLPISTTLQYVIHSLPAILVFTLPMGTLVAALIAFGRLSGESELTAIKVGGISFTRIATPAVLFSMVIAIIAILLNNYVAPNSTYISRSIFLKYFTGNAEGITEITPLRDTDEEGMERVIYINRLYPDENRMADVSIQYFKDGKRVREMFAYDVRYYPDKAKWYLKDAYIQDFDENQQPKFISSNREIYLPLDKSPGQLSEKRTRTPEEMDRKMLIAAIKDKQKEMIQEQKGLIKTNNKNNGHKKEATAANGQGKAEKRYNQLRVYYYQKIAIPFACFIFGLFGIPLGVRPHRASKAMGLGLSIVFIFIYYTLMSIGFTIGQTGRISPFIAAWAPNILFAATGIVLIIQQARE